MRPGRLTMHDDGRDLTVILDRMTATGVMVEVSGDLDLHSVQVLDSVLHRAAAGPAGRIQIDLGSVRFLSIAGLQPLLALARQHPSRVGFIAVSDAVRRLFIALGLDALLPPTSRHTDHADVATTRFATTPRDDGAP